MNIVRQLRGTIHWCRGDQILYARKRSVYYSRDGGRSVAAAVRLPARAAPAWKSTCRLTERIFRQGLIDVLEIDHGKSLLLATKKALFQFDLENRELLHACDFPRHPPLRMAWDGKHVIFGEYFLNRDRQPVAIWLSEDRGRSWHQTQTFSDVRHIHGCFHDPYDNGIWITSGDLDGESHLRFTTDQFSTVNTMYTGAQLFRTIDIAVQPDAVYYGTDTPMEKNYIVRMNRSDRQIERLQEVGGSVFYLRKIPQGMACTTAVEASDVNTSKFCELWFSQTGQDWEILASFKKDIWPTFYLQHGRLLLPSGPGTPEGVWIGPLATQSDNQSCLVSVNGA